MSPTLKAALATAERLGLIETVTKAIVAIVSGKPTLAARLAQNDALAAGALLAAERRKAKR